MQARVFSDRDERLTGMGGGLRLRRTFPLLREFDLPAGDFALLRRSVEHYLSACLHAAGCQVTGDGTDDAEAGILTTHREEILRLPNLTPNGLLLPKKDVLLEFNVVQRTAAVLLRELRLDDSIDVIQLPLNVRIVDGKTDAGRDRRAYASGKLHSDIWAGEPSNAILVMLPLLGDTSTNVEFFEPDERFLGYIRMLQDYTEAEALGSGATRYECELTAARGYLMDPYLLHRTVRRGGGIRVSIDFRFVSRVAVPTDVAWDADKLVHYAPLDCWYAIGGDRILLPDESFEECRTRIRQGSTGTAAIGLRAF